MHELGKLIVNKIGRPAIINENGLDIVITIYLKQRAEILKKMARFNEYDIRMIEETFGLPVEKTLEETFQKYFNENGYATSLVMSKLLSGVAKEHFRNHPDELKEE